VFAAIVAPPVLGVTGPSTATDRIPEVMAILAAGLGAWRTGRVTWVLVVGMLTLWGLRAVGL
jgi:branched-subunit amino acid transport protein